LAFWRRIKKSAAIPLPDLVTDLEVFLLLPLLLCTRPHVDVGRVICSLSSIPSAGSCSLDLLDRD
jgi:hypothetical protein